MPKITYYWHLKYDCTRIILPSCTEILLNLWVFGPNYSLNVPFDDCLLCCYLLIIFFVHCFLWSWSISRSYSLFCSQTYYQNHLSLITIVVGYELLFLPIFIQWGNFIVLTEKNIWSRMATTRSLLLHCKCSNTFNLSSVTYILASRWWNI